MFRTKADVTSYFEDTELAPFAEELTALARPALVLVEDGEPCVHCGKSPSLGSGVVWPSRPAYAKGATIARTLARRDDVAVAAARSMDLPFLASIELPLAMRSGHLGTFLPSEGQLLFFWDSVVGPWIESAESCRVIWDRSAKGDRSVRGEPSALTRDFKSFERSGIEDRSGAVAPCWSLPSRHIIADLTSNRDLVDAVDSDMADNAFEQLEGIYRGEYEAAWETMLPHHIGGWPVPEQFDPRFSAAASQMGVLDLFVRTPSQDETSRARASMAEWVQLLQVSLAGVSRDYAEGTVYFVMRERDLAQRDFSRVHAIYQQT